MGKNARLRKRRRERQRQLQPSPAKTGLAKLYQKQHPESILITSGAVEKMSEVIEDFAEPLLSMSDSPEDIKKSLTVAMIAWNYSLLPDEQKDESDIPLLTDPTLWRVFENLLVRKEQLYPDIKRAIVDFEFIPNGSRQFQFNVISTLG
jgi:hypothetical protein